MPEELRLSSIAVTETGLDVTAVEARRYLERDEEYDREATSEEGLPVHLRAHVERVARTLVVLRWDVSKRHAALHITQSSRQGLERDHYRNVRQRFADRVSNWLDLKQFEDVDLHKALHKLHSKEQTDPSAPTKSRQGDWETVSGSRIDARSASTSESMFRDKKLMAAVHAVADQQSGQSGNLYWLPQQTDPLPKDGLHITIIASDSRINFMRPSSEEAISYVLGQIRSLL